MHIYLLYTSTNQKFRTICAQLSCVISIFSSYFYLKIKYREKQKTVDLEDDIVVILLVLFAARKQIQCVPMTYVELKFKMIFVIIQVKFR